MSEDVKSVDAAVDAASVPQAQPVAPAASAESPAQAVSARSKPRVKAVVKPAAKPALVRAAKAKPAQSAKPVKPAKVAKTAAAAKPVRPKAAKAGAVAARTAAKPIKPVKSARIAAKAAKAPAAPQRAAETDSQPKTAADPIATLKRAAQSAATQFKDKTMNKTTTLFTDYADFAKGNLEAVVASGKILFAGLQTFGSSVASDSKAAMETFKTDAKDLAAARTPTEFAQLQSDMLRRNWDTAVACASKNSAAMVKLANETIEPIADRVNLAVDRVRKAA